tara:strand:- start:46130 stop:47674 length:1545 start_codon:yes stop_codon:yes gene_type:complete
MKKKILLVLVFMNSVSTLFAKNALENDAISIGDLIDSWFQPIVSKLELVFFADLFQLLGFDFGVSLPFIVVWLVFGAVFFTLKMNFINFRGFRHAIELVQGKYDDPDDKGEVSHFQALTTALSATVGLGNIASVAVAITIGGPGATFWMIVAGILGMSTKFTEVTLGVKYREIDENGEVSGGPMYYLTKGLKHRSVFGLSLSGVGKVLAVMFAIIAVMATFGGGNMFQANQAFAQAAIQLPFLQGHGFYFGIGMALLVGVVIIGGIQSIARVTEKIVPFMAVLYVLSALIILGVNYANIPTAFGLIISEAFNPISMTGGFIGVLMTGFQRASFSNEAGVGSAAIAHSAVKTNEPVSEGFVALLEPFIDTVVICTMTALVIIITGEYKDVGLEGSELTSKAFGSVISWFPMVLAVAVFLFAFSTMISWSYYGLKSWTYLFGNKPIIGNIYKVIFLVFVVIGSSTTMGAVLSFSDMMILAMAFPNIIGLLIMSTEVKLDMQEYMRKVKNGLIKQFK